MKEKLLQLQIERDQLRSQLNSKFKRGEFENELLMKQLSNLDGLFNRLCKKKGFKLSKFGRLN